MGGIQSYEVREDLKKLRLSGAQVAKLRERFEMISDSFGLEREEVQTLYKAKPQELDLIFEVFDPRSSGKVDAYEFIAGMIIIADASLESKADTLFELYDFDYSQTITFDELIIMLRTAVNALCYMTGASLMSMEDLEDHANRVFGKIDTNSDSYISLVEWLSFITKDSEAIEVLEKLQLISEDDKRENWGPEDEVEVDSDLENETSKRDWNRSNLQERVKEGIEYMDEAFLINEVGQGDQFLAVKPWEGVVRNSVPSNYRPKKGDDDPPEAYLELEYIHGYRCHDVRNNLRYSASGEVVYHTAAVGVVLDQDSNTQRHFLAHTDDIISFDISLDGTLAVTGEIGRNPLICVWNTETMECVKSFKGILKRGVQHVCFSDDGTKIAAMGADDMNCVVVYDISSKATKPGPMSNLVATGKAGRGKFLDLKFQSSKKLVACGLKVFEVLSIGNGAIVAKKGTGWNKTQETKQQALLSIGFVGNTTLTGAYNGCIFKWNETSLLGAIKAHNGAVTCIGPRIGGEGFVSGGNDHNVKVFDSSLNEVECVNLLQVQSVLPKARSVCEKSGKVLVGTRGGEIIEVSGGSSQVLLKGHFDRELWGIAANPKKAEFATAGQDNLLAFWDLTLKKQKNCLKLEGPAMCVNYSPDGTLIAVGLENGKLLVFETSGMSIVFQAHDRTKAISVVKFSPDGEVLAVGAHDSLILTYFVVQKFKLQYKLRGHHSTITHLDFSETSNVIQSNSTSYEILYHELGTGRLNSSGASAYKDEKWGSWTCVLGWPVQGIWPPCSDGSDINALERSKSKKVVATVDDFSQVKLLKYPCVNKGAGFNVYKGHSSHVTNLAFLEGYLVTTGGNDKAIFQWKYTEDQEEQAFSQEAFEAAKEVETHEVFEIQQVGEGDQFLAVKPWKGEVTASTPSDYSPPPNQSKPPQESLKLLKVHGYRSFDSRNNLKYTASGNIVYPAAALGVVMNLESREQQFFSMHDDDVVCLAIHPNRQVVATGQMAHVGKSRSLDLYVWDAETMEPLAHLTGFHRRAIRHLGFSPNGELLLSVGQDDDHSLAVYDWKNKRQVCSAKVDKDLVLGANFVKDNEVCIFGAKFIKFFTLNGKNITGRRGILGRKNFEAQICGVEFNGKFVTGTHTGNLFVWSGGSLLKTVKAHSRQVWALCSNQDELLTGGSEGTIAVWNPKFEQVRSVSIEDYSLCAGIRSIDVNPSGSILLGTRGAEIIEIKNWEDVENISTGHFNGELWGLAVHPFQPMCATCGGDKTIRVWDLVQGVMLLAIKPLPHDMRAIDWSPDGGLLVSGLVNGVVILLDSNSLSTLSTLQSSFKGKDCWIEDIKFSPDGSKVAFGAHGGASRIEIAGVQNKKLVKMYTINAGLTSALTHLDWSVDGALIVANSQAYELKFVNVEGKRNIASSSVRTVEWATWTCVLGWPVQFIWPKYADGTDVNSCVRSCNHNLLATSDDFGNVNLFRYPVVIENQACDSYTGHSSHVTKVKFSHDDSFLVSTGGNDKCVFVWQTDVAGADLPVQELADEELFDIYSEKSQEEAFELTKAKATAAIESDNPSAFFEFEDQGEGDQFLAVKPWQGALRAPSGYIKPPRNQNKPPNLNLELEFVHGYRAKDSRNNLKYLPDGRIIYHAAALGITYSKANHSQAFFDKHVDDILAFTLSSSGQLAATGEVGRRPNIYVWNTNSMASLANFKQPLQNGIAALAFTPSESKLVAVGMDDNHSIAVYDLTAKALMCSFKGDREKILDVAWISEKDFVTSGLKHFKVWSGPQFSGRRGQFGPCNSLLVSLAVQGASVYTGNVAGQIIRWNGTSALKPFQVHERAVDSLWACESCIVSGSKDGMVYILDNKLSKRQSFNLNSPQYESVCAFIRSACLSEDGNSLLVGTYGSEIYEIDVKTSQAKNLVKGHYTPCRAKTVTNELWGLEVLPSGQEFVTSSDDGTLRVWSISEKKQLHIIKFTEAQEVPNSAKARCLGVHPSGSALAVGFKDGSFKVYETSTWSLSAEKKNRKQEISDIKFSPDGRKLAVGSHDNFIDIYNFPELRQVAVCKGHSSYITHFDWSCDSSSLQSNCGAYELLFWDANSGKQFTSGASMLKDEDWATWSCVIGWPVQGIYPPYADGTDINGVDRSRTLFGNNEYRVLATSDDHGLVKVFRYPCLTKGSEAVVGRGHSSHVTHVKFDMEDRHLISVGGDDQCIFQWKVLPKK